MATWITGRNKLTQALSRLHASFQQSFEYGRPNMRYFAVLEMIGQPVYYVLWRYIYPQPYENLWLRASCMLFALPMFFEKQAARYPTLERFLPFYWLFCLLFELPFFFHFMLLMNSMSAVWVLSGLASLMILVILVFDWLATLLLVVVGSFAAVVVFFAIGGEINSTNEIPIPVVIMIYMFGLIAGSAMNYKAELVAREKMAAITDAVGTAAHELRTPLLGIRSGASGLSLYMPTLMRGYRLARETGLPVESIRQAHLRQLEAVLGRIQSESAYAGTVLDMLLINSNRSSIDRSNFDYCAMSDCIEDALDRYPFQPPDQREWVTWSKLDDFEFFGSRLLMIHVLFNLLKNAIYHLEQVGRSDVDIWMVSDTQTHLNELHFRDAGPGIPLDQMPRIFERFYSGLPRGQGTGIGLAFAKLVVSSFDGSIRCESVLGKYTEFIMTFPDPYVTPV